MPRASVDADGVDTYPPAAWIIARMPARMGSGSMGQASMRVARSGSMGPVWILSAPDSAPPSAGNGVFSRISIEVRIPPPPLRLLDEP
jgi:hypothetical protein